MRPFVLAVIERGEGDAEAVLPVPDEDVRILGELHFNGPALRRTYQLAVDLEVLEDQGNGTFLRHVQGVEPGEPVRAAEHERSVRKKTRSPVGELVASDAVLVEVVDEGLGRPVVLAQAIHGGHPDVALPVLFDGADVKAWDTLY